MTTIAVLQRRTDNPAHSVADRRRPRSRRCAVPQLSIPATDTLNTVSIITELWLPASRVPTASNDTALPRSHLPHQPIPIAQCAHSPAPSPAGSFLGGFRTPALVYVAPLSLTAFAVGTAVAAAPRTDPYVPNSGIRLLPRVLTAKRCCGHG